MKLYKTLSFYKQQNVLEKLLEHAKDREIAIRYNDYFGKRPNTLEYKDDILQAVKAGAVSFHCSEERWINPQTLRTGMRKKELNTLRKGWDLILDIDCDHFPYSRLAAHHLINILEEEEVTTATTKFSGNKGFHLAVPFEAFPSRINGIKTEELFPDAPKRIAQYLTHRLRPILSQAIIHEEKGDLKQIATNAGIATDKVIIKADGESRINIDEFLDIDTVLISSRHLFRMPYSFHEKSKLVSLPVQNKEIKSFERLDAKPDRVTFNAEFLQREAPRGDAKRLVRNAYDFKPTHEDPRVTKKQDSYETPEEAIEKTYFPPCIDNILGGLEDGRKRAIFTLTNFLRSAGYTLPQIEDMLHEWNKKNDEPLREVHIKTQIRQAQRKQEVVPPHNCPHAGTTYYEDLGVCTPDDFCQRIKNPVQYARFKKEISEE